LRVRQNRASSQKGAGLDAESFPTFTAHRATNGNIFWITPSTLTNTIIYALDADTGLHWPAPSADGQRFLAAAAQQQVGYKLYGSEWIGARK